MITTTKVPTIPKKRLAKISERSANKPKKQREELRGKGGREELRGIAGNSRELRRTGKKSGKELRGTAKS